MIRSSVRAAAVAAALAFLSQVRLASAQQAARAELAVAESALARGDLDRAVDLARAYTGRHGNDWRGWYVQGQATLARGCTANDCRVAAIIAFRRATRLASERIEVWDGYGRAGLELGNIDGELILHEAYEHVLALDPLYPGAWENWLKPFRNRSDRERVRRILATHDSIPAVRGRIAQLLIEDEQYAAADTVLDALLTVDPRQPGWLALRAQSAFESGDTATGAALYERALARADRDGGDVLWQQAIGTATPGEIRAWEAGIPESRRPGFLSGFWARRNPDLFAGINLRVAEHFARLRVARREFPATHPLSGYKTRQSQRVLGAGASPAEQLFYQRCEAREFPGGPVHAADRAKMGDNLLDASSSLYATSIRESWTNVVLPPGQFYDFGKPLPDTPYSRDLRDIDTTAAALGYNLRTGLDDRGLTYLRFGAPVKRTIGSTNTVDPFCALPDLERWEYDDIGTVRFFRPEAVNAGALNAWSQTGEQIFRPMGDRQFEAVEQVMTRNATSVPALLSFGVWTAQFAGGDTATTAVVVVTTRGAAAAQLSGALGEAGPPVTDAAGAMVLAARPGVYALMANARVADTLGRQSLRVTVHPLGQDWGASDLLLASAWPDTTITRSAMLRHLQRDLIFAPGSTVRAYAEVYGLRPSSDGRVRYRASYQVYATHNLAQDADRDDLPGGVHLTFERQRAWSGWAVGEWLDITPERLPPGRYLLRLEVLEPRGVQVMGRAQIGFEIRRP